jgi:hypothetical protein
MTTATVTDDRYQRTTYTGKPVDKWTAQALDAAARLAGVKITLTQGSWSTNEPNSAGTHAGAGAGDIRVTDLETARRVVKALRQCGFAAWLRLPNEGPWVAHIHFVQIGNAHLAPAAARQVEAYLIARNGLANNGPDTGPRILTPRPYPYQGIPTKKAPTMNNVQYGRQLINAGLAELAKAVRRPQIDVARRAITLILSKMPKE